MSRYYNTGKLTRDINANEQYLRAGTWAVVSVEEDINGLYVAVCSGSTNVWLPFYDTDYESLLTH